MNGFFIGRFQPFHLGHMHAIQYLMIQTDNLWIGIGSSNKSGEIKNPFTFNERKNMIFTSLDQILLNRIKIYPIPDFNDHNKWLNAINLTVPKYDIVFSNDPLTNSIYSKHHVKTSSILLQNRLHLSGTNIRNKIINCEQWEKLVPLGTKETIQKINVHERLNLL